MKRRVNMFLLILGGILITCGIIVLLLNLQNDNNLNGAELVAREVRSLVISIKDTDDSEDGLDDLSSVPPVTEPLSSARKDPLKRVVDLDLLREINRDAAFWLFIPDTPVDYPVMAADSDYYLSHDIFGNTGSWGSLFTYKRFLDCDVKLIFGHHVTGYSPAFGELEKYLDVHYAMEHPNAYVYQTDQRMDIYKFYATLDTDTNDLIYDTYYYRKNSDRWAALLAHLSHNAEVFAGRWPQLGGLSLTPPLSAKAFDGSVLLSPQELLVLTTCREYNTSKRVAVVFSSV